MAQRVMSALGFEAQGVQPAAWVAIGHGTSTNGNQHIHIAASLARMDGGQVNIWQDRKTLSRVCAEFEADYGLTIVEGREGKGMPGLSRAELERTTRAKLLEGRTSESHPREGRSFCYFCCDWSGLLTAPSPTWKFYARIVGNSG
jgi:hypothetical protein